MNKKYASFAIPYRIDVYRNGVATYALNDSEFEFDISWDDILAAAQRNMEEEADVQEFFVENWYMLSEQIRCLANDMAFAAAEVERKRLNRD